MQHHPSLAETDLAMQVNGQPMVIECATNLYFHFIQASALMFPDPGVLTSSGPSSCAVVYDLRR